MKRYTDKKAAMYCNRVLSASRAVKEYTGIKNAWEDKQGRTYVCDGYRAYRLNSSPDGLSVLLGIFPSAEKVKKAAHVRAGIEGMFDALDGWNLVPMPAPDAEQVKAAARHSVYDDGIKFDLGADFPTVNAKYLRDVIEMFPGAVWYCTDGDKRMTSPIYAVSPDGAAIVLPIRTEAKRAWKCA